ncbi:E3 ubiquitin-protein ligase KEG isoform X1 [Scleropages formosus]|uniref:E3 ubiquitin-protein ligase KEG isoform X1 n=2 Tax=Scleropages formosus TaxID=113540 RepID=UPI0008785AB1|nr:E3 ubiquitin-protein ligase KEG-like isoform X1 [Scleropages formosus]
MVLYEDKECSVCFLPYSRQDRVPRVLHCEHTFCAPCLELIAQLKDGLLTVRCPLCRQTTYVNPDRGLQGALWVDVERWEQISEDDDEEEEKEAEQENQGKKTQLASTEEWPSSKPSRPKIKLPAFLRRLHFTKHQQQETLLPTSNVQMKSWRRLSPEEMI